MVTGNQGTLCISISVKTRSYPHFMGVRHK
nr:MAG TPA: hypothetical protein [Caudoviricetes sp.]